MLMSWRCLRVSVWKRRSVDPEVKATQIPTPAIAMCETTMPSSWWASSWLCGSRERRWADIGGQGARLKPPLTRVELWVLQPTCLWRVLLDPSP